MTPETLFGHASALAIGGWILLAGSVVACWRLGRDLIAGLAIPALLSGLYVAIIAANWSSGEGGFDSLAAVAALFRSPWLLLAGWVHYLAFDLFVGSWIARDASARGVSRWLVLPLLPLTLMFGPAGLLAWLILRTAVAPRAIATETAP